MRPEASMRPKALSRQRQQLCFCRSCYGHLAGRVGVAVARALQDRDHIRSTTDRQFIVTPAGAEWFAGIDVDVASLKPTRRGIALQCLDWTERVHHLGGPLGVHLMSRLCELGWLRRSKSSRAIELTRHGATKLRKRLGIDLGQIELVA